MKFIERWRSRRQAKVWDRLRRSRKRFYELGWGAYREWQGFTTSEIPILLGGTTGNMPELLKDPHQRMKYGEDMTGVLPKCPLCGAEIADLHPWFPCPRYWKIRLLREKAK